MSERSLKKEKIGKVLSNRMDKTVTVETSTREQHSQYGKYYVRRKKFKAHDEKQIAGMGDTIRVVQTRPISKTKNWKVVEVIKKSDLPEEAAPKKKIMKGAK